MAGSLLNGNGSLNVPNYNDKVRKQREVFSQIDSTMAILEKLPEFVDNTMDIINANSFTFSVSPLGFLFNLLNTIGVSDDTLKKWITEILVYVLPSVEIGVKGALLANIKALISCNSDPRIPLGLRKKVTNTVYSDILNGDNRERGIDINIDSIDPDGILDLSPFTEPGSLYYFGIEDKATVDEKIANVVRAYDFNAFLWYVIHKGNKQNPIKLTISNGTFTHNRKSYTIKTKTYNVKEKRNADSIVGSKNDLLGVSEIICNDTEEGSDFIAGTTFYEVKSPNTISVCIEAKTNMEGIITANTLVNLSSDWFSCNWYVDTSNYYSTNIGIKSKKNVPRDYGQEKAICNLRYCQQKDYVGNALPQYPGNFRFTILPKPYVLLPTINKEKNEEKKTEKISVQWRPIRLMFDSNGVPTQDGKYSLISEFDSTATLRNKRTNGDFITFDVYGIGQNGRRVKGADLNVNIKTGQYNLSNVDNLSEILVECYPGLTVYEFNYDYVMGLKLFDPKVVCERIFLNAANPTYDASFQFTFNKQKDKHRYPYFSGKQRLLAIVRDILEEDEDEINDCFYKFSNEQYDEMLKKTEEIRYKQMPYNQGYNDGDSIDFTDVFNILNEYPENGTLEEQKTVIYNAITAACGEFQKRKNVTALSDSTTTTTDFLTNVLQQLVAAIVNAVLSPKVLMLMEVNRYLLEPDADQPFDTEELMRILKNVIKAVVKEVRDLIMQKLLDYIIEYLTPLALQIRGRVVSEQFAAYMAIIKLLMSWFNKGLEVATRLSSILSKMLSKYGSDYDFEDMEIDLPSILDEVTYADIYPTDKKDKEPIIGKC